MVSPFGVLHNQLKINSMIRQEEIKMIIDSVFTIACGGKSGEVGSFLGRRDCNDYVRRQMFSMFLNSTDVEEVERIARDGPYTFNVSAESVDLIFFYVCLFCFIYFYFFRQQQHL
jgi:hypothetical protein